jgi:hypothetical protein
VAVRTYDGPALNPQEIIMKTTPHGDAMTLLLILAFACASHFASGRTNSQEPGVMSGSTAATSAGRTAGFDMSDYDPGYPSGGLLNAFFDGTEAGMIELVAAWENGR